jgi:hypothetical protein
MANFRALRRNLLREEYFAITGDTFNALILNQFVYWTMDAEMIDQYLEEESRNRGDADENPYLTYGWITKSAKDIARDCMLSLSPTAILRRVGTLVIQGLLIERHNPKDVFDRALQYRVNLNTLMDRLREEGYTTIPGMTEIAIPNVSTSAACISQNGECTFPKTVNVPYEESKELNIDKRRNSKTIQASFIGLTPVTIQEDVTGAVRPSQEATAATEHVLNGKDSKAKRTKKETKPADQRLKHEAVIAYRDVAHLTPNDVVRELLVTTFSEPTEQTMKAWRETIADWISRGWNKSNVKGMLEYHKTRTKEANKKRKVLGEDFVVPEDRIKVKPGHVMVTTNPHRPNGQTIHSVLQSIGNPETTTWKPEEEKPEVFDSPF